MSIAEVENALWTRKHDMPQERLIAPKIVYPTSLEDLIEICATRPRGKRLKAAGSHWALSQAAISDDIFIETHDPNNIYRAMGRTLYDVVPGCLHQLILDVMSREHPAPFGADNTDRFPEENPYLVHIETGKRIYQLYAELDRGDDANPESLAWHLAHEYDNDSYGGPWAFRTLGGAGGQTVFGALTTGTHGGDFRLPPIADDVAAMHLVTDGGKHYWIEPRSQYGDAQIPLTDDHLLRATYGTKSFGGSDNFDIIRNDAAFNAVLVSAGRFGIVYSIVLRAVRQYSLHEERRLMTWQDVKSLVGDPTSSLFAKNRQDPNRFLQIAVCLTPHANFQKNLCGVTRRWNALPLPNAADANGRSERVGRIVVPFAEQIQSPRFEFAGNSIAYSPDPEDPNAADPESFLERACASTNIFEGVLEEALGDLRRLIEDNAVLAGSAIAAVAAIGGAGTLLALLTPLTLILALLLGILAALRAAGGRRSLGEVMNDIKDALLSHGVAGLFAWQLVSYVLFARAQKNLDYNAISYAVMDRHDYHDASCNVNADSIEVFFDAEDPMLIAFIDALIAYEIQQEARGLAFVGYASLRFTAQTRALIGMQRYPLTCAVEISGLKDVTGVTDLIDYAILLSRDRNFGAILHWGQRNESTAADIEFRFGDGTDSDLALWRDVLARITDGGRLDGFSSAFTRDTGLEIT
jgi:hypothetical protein